MTILHLEADSIHLGSFAKVDLPFDADAVKAKLERLLLIRSDVFKALENARNAKTIGKSLEAHVQAACERCGPCADRRSVPGYLPSVADRV